MDIQYWLCALAAALVGLSKGGVPAIGMVAVPLLSVVMSPVHAAALLLPIYVLSDVVGVYLYRHAFSLAHLRRLLPAGILGVGLGWLTASRISDTWVELIIGLMGVIFCVYRWWHDARSHAADLPTNAANTSGWQTPVVTKLLGWFWGGIAGFASFISHAGAPPYQIHMLPQRLPKAEYAGTATLFFAVINLVKIAPYQHLRPYTNDMLNQALHIAPFAIGGAVLGAFFVKRVPENWFYQLVQLSLLFISLYLIYQASVSL